jgi:hypothetical protein
MKTQIAPLLLGLALTLPHGARAEGPAGCAQQLFPGDMNEFTCPVKASATPQRLRFVVRLSGSHDDSSSTLEVKLGDVNLPCEDGSKVRSDAEDGNVVMVCRFTLPAAAAEAPRVLVASLKATHVVIDGHALTAD